jgi:hypothetical protein
LRGWGVVEVKATTTPERYARKHGPSGNIKWGKWSVEMRKVAADGRRACRVIGVSDAAPEAMVEGGECCSDMKSREKNINSLGGVLCWATCDSLF